MKKGTYGKTALLMITAIIIMLTLSATPTFAETPFITIDGERLPIPGDEPGPYINAQNRTMIPVSFVSRELGAEVDWNANDRVVTITGNDKEILLKIGMSEANVNGETVSFDTKAVILQSRTFVPLRFVSEAMGLLVTWDAERCNAAIYTEDSAEAEAEIQSMQDDPEEAESEALSETYTESEVADELSEIAREVVRLTNLERTKRGLDPLDINVELMKVAESKSLDMQQNKTMSHDSPKYGGLRGLLTYYAVDCQMAAENIARGYRTAEQVVEGWMNSPGHRDNILTDEVTTIGVGVVECETGPYWTQLLIS